MAVSGIEIFKQLPKTNCKDCGFATCLAFAMSLAQGKTELSLCPHVSDEAGRETRRRRREARPSRSATRRRSSVRRPSRSL